MTVAKVNKAYYQKNAKPSGHAMVAYVNPAYYQPGYLHKSTSLLHGAKGGGVTKHGAKGAHAARLHGSPLPPMRDPFGHKGMGKTR